MGLITRMKDVQPYETRDGSQIFELMHPDQQGNSKQSLALAVIPAGETTKLHKHRLSEEIYHVQSGAGKMTLADEQFLIKEGDTICILPGSLHCVENMGAEDLKILCCCAPAYSHADTELNDNE